MSKYSDQDARYAQSLSTRGSAEMDLSSGVERDVPSHWRRHLWNGGSTLEQQSEAYGREEQGQGALSNGGERSSRRGCTDGGDQRGDRRRSGDPRLWFDRDIARDGYQWWYLDCISDDHDFSLTVIGFIGHVFSPRYFRARAQAHLRGEEASPLSFCALNFALHALTPQGESKLGCKTLWCMTEHSRLSQSGLHIKQ